MEHSGLIIIAAIIFLCIIIIFIYYLEYNLSFNFYDHKVKNLICHYAAFYAVTDNMPENDIYTKRGAIRVPVSRKIESKYKYYSMIFTLNLDAFACELFNKNIVDDNEMIKNRDIKSAARIFLKFLSYKNTRSMSVSGMTPEEFFIRKNSQEKDITGVYILYNKTKRKYYVGQASRVFFRINKHFTGHGNGDVYADYKYGDEFLIKYIRLNDSGFESLDALEKAKIAEYDAYNRGYNKTSGNGLG